MLSLICLGLELTIVEDIIHFLKFLLKYLFVPKKKKKKIFYIKLRNSFKNVKHVIILSHKETRRSKECLILICSDISGNYCFDQVVLEISQNLTFPGND